MKKRLGVLLITIVMAICTVAFFGCSNNPTPKENDFSEHVGMYYLYQDNVKQSDDWIELKSDGTWTDNLSASGTYTITNGRIIVYSVILGENTELMSGEISNGTITISFMGETTIYKKDSGSQNVSPPPSKLPQALQHLR